MAFCVNLINKKYYEISRLLIKSFIFILKVWLFKRGFFFFLQSYWQINLNPPKYLVVMQCRDKNQDYKPFSTSSPTSNPWKWQGKNYSLTVQKARKNTISEQNFWRTPTETESRKSWLKKKPQQKHTGKDRCESWMLCMFLTQKRWILDGLKPFLLPQRPSHFVKQK